MPIRESLPPVLRGEKAADLSPEAVEQLEALARAAEAEGMSAFVRDECAARLRQPGATLGVEYLLAAACAQNDEIERAHQTLLGVGDKLAAGMRWETLTTVAERALELSETQAAARLLVRAHEGLGRDPDRLEALERAWSLIPEDLDLGLLLAVRLGEAGHGERRRELLAELLPRFATEGRTAGLEEAALEFAEHEDRDGLVRLVETLPLVADPGALEVSRQLIDIALPIVVGGGRAGELLPALRALVARAAAQGAPAVRPFRSAVAAALRQGPARMLPDPESVMRIAGIEDPTRELPSALELFDAVAALPPGSPVHHESFGAGRVTSDDGGTVLVDFAHGRGHRMTYAAARRTLTRIADDDLRLLAVTDAESLARMRREEPAEMILRALRALGGKADAQRLKVFLVGLRLVPANEWTSFWRKAQAAAELDPSIDSSRAFEQRYQLADEVAGATGPDQPLPALEPRRSVRSNLVTLRKFLQQHATAEEALARRFGRYVERVTFDREGDRADRARAGLFFSRWFPDRAVEWTATLKHLWEQGLGLSDLSGEDEQLALLEASHAAGVESDAILSGLDSRFAAVRDAALRRRDQLDDAGRRDLRSTLVTQAPRYPVAALRLLEAELTADAVLGDGWQLLWVALSLIEERPKPSVAHKVQRWLEPGGLFDRLLAGQACEEYQRLQIRVLLREWRSSDRFLIPALDAVERLGLIEEAEWVRSDRRRRTDRLFDRVGQPAEDTSLPVMTRATWERLHGELERLQRELRTTIPAAIQKARELGDLRENAEYHSAKLKQANVSRLVGSLQTRLSRARFVDDVEHRDGTVGLGSEVVLESQEDVVTYWVLGEEEHLHGEHVVSFQSAVGRALVGRSIGEEIDLGEGSDRRRYRVVSVERKLPPAESDTTP